jgi:HK97 family phage major capsid protein
MNLEQLRALLIQIRARMKARMEAIAAANPARTISDDEAAAQVADEAEETSVSRHIGFLERMEAREQATAQVAIQAQVATAEPARPRVVNAPAVLTRTTQAQRNGDKFKGQSVARFAIAMAAAKITGRPLADIMEERFSRDRPELLLLARAWHRGGPGALHAGRVRAADIAGGGSTASDWGNELVQMDGQFTGDFIDLLRAKTVFDQLPLTVVPANVTIKGQDGTGVAYWVGQHKSIPMSAQDYSAVSLTPLKIGALTAISIELTEDSSPDAEQLVTNSLVKDSAQLLDAKFFSADAASAGVSPAGMLNGLSQVQASAGADLNGLIADTNALVQAFITAKNTGGLHWASLPSIARNIADFRNLMGQRVYDTLTEAGGTYDGKPYHTTDNAGAGDLVLMKPSDVYKIGDSGLAVDVSTEATLEFGSAPTGAGDTPADASENPVSLFQAGMIGIRLFRRINWAKRRSTAVQFIGNTAYVPQIQTA